MITGEDQTTFYSFLSIDQRQDTGTVAHNMQIMLKDLCYNRNELSVSQLKVLICIVDGNAVQYRSWSVCYELFHLAIKFNIVNDRIVQAPDHGKCIADSQNSLDKTLLDMFFGCLVALLEAQEEEVKTILTQSRDEKGNVIRLSKICLDTLNNLDITRGSKCQKDRAKF
ncbi:hypothetical protein ACHAWF_006076 [Thalassiosira exigua]